MVEAEADDALLRREEIKAKLEAARRKKEEASFQPKTTKIRRAAETKQRKQRVNPSLLRDDRKAGRDETWTIRARDAQVRAVKELSADLSQPGAKVSIAALMDEAIDLLLAKYRSGQGG